MKREVASPLLDQVLLPFVYAKSEAESELVLERLVCDHAQPLIRDIVGFKLRAYSPRSIARDSQELDDLCGEVILKLIRKLRQLKAAPGASVIASLRGYVATMAYNESDEYVRRKHPRRFSCKNKLRYVLTHQQGLALWDDPSGSPVCGLARWRGRASSGAATGRLRALLEKPHRFLEERLAGRDPRRVELDTLVGALLDHAGAPVSLDDLVSTAVELLGVHDAEAQRLDDIAAPESGRSVGAIEDSIDQRVRLRLIWNEITLLPPRQRSSLLLNLRDESGDAALTLLPMLRIATIREISQTLEMPVEELASLWQELPLEDAVIASLLGATRQQVINLRKCARERLSRRMRTADAE